jgi:hypothetical protein
VRTPKIASLVETLKNSCGGEASSTSDSASIPARLLGAGRGALTQSRVLAKGAFVALLPSGLFNHQDAELAIVEFLAVLPRDGLLTATIDIRVPAWGSGEPIVDSYQLPLSAPIFVEATPKDPRIPLTYQVQGERARLLVSLRTLGQPEYVLDVELDAWESPDDSPPLWVRTSGSWQVFFYRW